MVIAIHVFIQGPLRTPKTAFLKSKMWLEIGASASQALKFPILFGQEITNLASDLKSAHYKTCNCSPKTT